MKLNYSNIMKFNIDKFIYLHLRLNSYIYFLKTRETYSTTFFIIGIIITLGFVILYNYKNSVEKDIKEIDSIEFQSNTKSNLLLSKDTIKETDIVTKTVTQTKPTKKKTKATTSITDTIIKDDLIDSLILVDSIGVDSIETFDTIMQDSTTNDINNDTQLVYYDEIIDTSIIIESNQEITLSKDKLIYTTYVIPEGVKDNFDCNNKNNYDSLLVNNTVNNKQEGIYIEYWESAINYTGYKLSRNTLILFGIYEYKKANYKYSNEGFIELKYKSNTFILKCTDTFVSLHLNK